MVNLDWVDIWLHAAIAVVSAANAMFWIYREYRQRRQRPWRIFTSPQSLLEWLVPSIIMPLSAYATLVVLGMVK